jgi:hypothetical protein
VLVLLTLVNAMIVIILTRRESAARHWGQAIIPIIWGLALSCLELGVMATLRAVLTRSMGLPF